MAELPLAMAGNSRRLAVLAGRLLRRDLASGRLLVMLAATLIAVASTVSVSLLVSRVEQVLLSEASALLAGDLAIASNEAPPRAYRTLADELGLRSTTTVTLRSVVASGERLQLVRLKAVDERYPLRGNLQRAAAVGAAPTTVSGGPARGEMWGDLKLLQLLGIAPGAELGVGRSRLRLGGVLVLEPDSGGDVFAIAPQALMHIDDLAATGLIVPGSRVGYTTLVAGEAEALARYRTRVELRPGDRLSDPRNARPELRSAFIQAERFLTLAAFTGVLLATVGVALAAQGYSEHHALTVAVLKTLGLGRRQTLTLLTVELTLLALLAAGLGDLLAIGVHRLLLDAFVPQLGDLAHALPWVPLVHGLAIACVTLGGFALPSLAGLARIPVTTVLTRDRTGFRPPALISVLVGLVTVIVIAPWHVGDARLVVFSLAGMLVATLVLAAASLVLVRVLGRLRGRTQMSWRFGLANIARRARLSVLQTTAVGLGIAVVLLLGLVRGDLVGQWTARLPDDAPNQFLINIQPDELPRLREFLSDHGLRAPQFYPMVRGRLTAINGAAVNPEDYADARARRLADREFNLSSATRMKPDNRLVAGRWWAADSREPELSVEEGIAETLGLVLGDELEFTIAGRATRGRVTSLRHVEWDNFEVNFFVVTTPVMLDDEPATYITSFHVEPGQTKLLTHLVERFPSVTVLDVDALMQQVRDIMARVSAALLWVFVFALIAGALVLAAAVQASQRERMQDTVLLKTLGASARFVRRTMLIEFGLLGLLAGTIGTLGAVGTGWALATWVLDMRYAPGWLVPFAGIASGVLGVSLVGMSIVRRALRLPVVRGLSEAG